MNYIFFAVIILCSFLSLHSQQCPAIYLRYSRNHSYCKPKNNKCSIYKSGVTPAERRQILDIHNKYRSYVATGKETKAGRLPQASDMLQMVWDKELADVAQKTAEQCIYQHDCNDCKRVENFEVGQNIAYLERQCTGPCPLNSLPDWKYVIKMFYDEVAIFDKSLIVSMKFFNGKEYGHFTQMVWSETWRIGCGYVAFKKGYGYRQLYFCNYGPSGNIVNQPMYKIGRAGSACPINSCSRGSSCSHPSYDGLCKMDNNNEAPIYRQQEKFIFYCDFKSSAGDCSNSVVGVNKWKFIQALGGSFAEIILNSGETSTIKFKNIIRPKQAFCVIVLYRTGPAVDGQKFSNTAVVSFEMPNNHPTIMNLPKSGKNFFQYSISLNWSYDTQISFTFSVPRGEPAQYFNIKLVNAKIGSCQ